MTSIKRHAKVICLLLSALILFQGCRIYKKDYTPFQKSNKMERFSRIKTDSVRYKFIYLIKENDKIYGIAKKHSKTAKLLSNQIRETKVIKTLKKKLFFFSERNHVAILLTNEQINNIEVINEAATIVVNLLITSAVTVGLFTLAINSMTIDFE